MGNNKRLQDYTLISGQGTPNDDKSGIIDIRDQFVNRSDTLEFYKNTGEIIYTDKSNTKHKGRFGLRDNGYLLLAFLAENPGKTFTAKELAVNLNNARSESISTDDRRIRDTIQTIRKELGLIKNKANDIFMVDKGFGIGCKIEIKL